MDIGTARSLRPGTQVIIRLLWPGASCEVDGKIVRPELRCETGPMVILDDFPDVAPFEVPREDIRLQ